MKLCKKCRHHRDAHEDERYSDEFGTAGYVTEYDYCNVLDEQCPDVFAQCPLVQNALKVLPAMCHGCESLQYCHFKDSGDLIFAVNFQNIVACYKEHFAEVLHRALPEKIKIAQ